MKKFQEWIEINEGKNSSNKTKAMTDLIDAFKKVFDEYDLSTRKKVWESLSTHKGKELINKIVKNPKTYLSNSEFVKLVQKESN